MTAEALLGYLANLAGLIEKEEPISAAELATVFTWDNVKKEAIVIDNPSVSLTADTSPYTGEAKAPLCKGGC